MTGITLDPATCDDGSEFFMTPEWIFYLAVLEAEDEEADGDA